MPFNPVIKVTTYHNKDEFTKSVILKLNVISMQHIPNIFTFFRILAIPVVVVLYYLQPVYTAATEYSSYNVLLVMLITIMSITDFLDGYLARKYHLASKFGEFLDPVADKILVTTLLILLIDFYNMWIITVASIIIILREIMVSAMREWLGQIGQREVINISKLGKVKTTLQFFGVIFLFYQSTIFGIRSFDIGIVLFLLATVFTVVSGISYMRVFVKHM